MPIATTYSVNHKCGHEQDHDLSGLAAGQRAGRAEWLASTDCTECWSRKRKRGVSKEVSAARQAEQAEAVAAAERDELPQLRGSAKQTEWGIRARYQVICAAYNTLVVDGGLDDSDFTTSILDPARIVDRAGWWIDNRDTEPANLAALLADTGEDPDAISSENPF